MTGERSYTTKIWRQPSSIGFSSADALSTSMDPPGEPVISTPKRPCQKIQKRSEFPELVAQNSRNPHVTQFLQGRLHSPHRFQHRWIEHFDVALLGYVWLGVTQYALHNFVVSAQCVQVRRNASPEPVPSIPRQPNRFNCRPNHLLRKSVH